MCGSFRLLLPCHCVRHAQIRTRIFLVKWSPLPAFFLSIYQITGWTLPPGLCAPVSHAACSGIPLFVSGCFPYGAYSFGTTIPKKQSLTFQISYSTSVPTVLPYTHTPRKQKNPFFVLSSYSLPGKRNDTPFARGTLKKKNCFFDTRSIRMLGLRFFVSLGLNTCFYFFLCMKFFTH